MKKMLTASELMKGKDMLASIREWLIAYRRAQLQVVKNQ